MDGLRHRLKAKVTGNSYSPVLLPPRQPSTLPGDTGQTRERISFHHNVFARNNERQIRFRHANRLIDYVNNVVYGWGWFEGGGYGLHVNHDDGEVNTDINVVANVFHYIDGLHGGDEDAAIEFGRGPDEGTVFFVGNSVPAGEADNVSSGARLDIPAYARVTEFAAADLGSEVVPLVGTHYPTTQEQALLTEIAAAIAP